MTRTDTLLHELREMRSSFADVEHLGDACPQAVTLNKAIKLLEMFTNSPFGDALCALVDEIQRAIAKHPGHHNMMLALGEEHGELARTFLEGEPDARIKEEAVQVACVAIRIATHGDASHGRNFDPDAH